ncbi:MAG: hypothetical protein D6725_15530 [Planctomycetota bacterium]|nr:MAG: hypothetical protein D6725_15530 [Planctomycetota bacterium]
MAGRLRQLAMIVWLAGVIGWGSLTTAAGPRAGVRADDIGPTTVVSASGSGPVSAAGATDSSVGGRDVPLAQLMQRIRRQQEQLTEQAARIENLERALRHADLSTVLPEPPPGATAGLRAANASSSGCGQDAPACGEAVAVAQASRPQGGEPPDGFPRFDIGGQYRVMFNAANFDFHEAVIGAGQPSQSFFNQRFRTWLTVRTSEHVEGYLQTEIGHVGFGDDLEFPKAFVGPRFPAGAGLDRVGIELRRGYITYTSEELGRWRVGIQGWSDSFDDTLASAAWDFNVGGLSWLATVPELADMQLSAGAFVLFEGDIRQADDAILWTLDGDWRDDRGNGLGWSVYAITDHGGYSYPTAAAYDKSWDVWMGLRGTWQTAAVPLHVFGIFNFGARKELGGLPDFRHHGFAAKLALGPVPFWFGRLRFQTLYSTGEGDPNDRTSSEFRTVAQSFRDNFGAQGYWSYVQITSPNAPGDVNDLGVSLQNRGLGLFTAQAAFDYSLGPHLSAVMAVGWLNAAARNPANGSREMGTELVKMFTYDFGGGLTADVGAAVLFTGDFYGASPAASRPDVLWEAFSRVQLEF